MSAVVYRKIQLLRTRLRVIDRGVVLLLGSWRLRLLSKLLLSRLPIDYKQWKKLALFQHGAMESAEYAYNVFVKHFFRSGLAGKPGLRVLELGPGDSCFSALIGKAHGVSETYLVDAGDFITREIEPYRIMHEYLVARGLPLPEWDNAAELADLSARYNFHFGARGIESLRTIADDSIHFIWSHAVLEHVRLNEFDAQLEEMRRILVPGGICSHRVDLRDHLGGVLNNLRFFKEYLGS